MYEGYHPPKPLHKSSAQPDVVYTGNARTNRSKSRQKWAALTLTAVQGV